MEIKAAAAAEEEEEEEGGGGGDGDDGRCRWWRLVQARATGLL
jgi:hypothetical protein